MLKWTRRIILFVVLGAVVNVLVAWGFATRADLLTGRGRYDNLTAEDIDWWMHNVPDSWPIEVPNEAGHTREFGRHVDQIWSRRPIPDAGAQSGYRLQTGFPLVSLEYQRWIEGLGRRVMPRDRVAADVSSGVWELPSTPHFPGSNHALELPVQPIWLGFATDTVLYGVMCFGTFAGIRLIVRRRRLKRGLCPVCKYPIGASEVCTECGMALARRSTPGQDHRSTC